MQCLNGMHHFLFRGGTFKMTIAKFLGDLGSTKVAPLPGSPHCGQRAQAYGTSFYASRQRCLERESCHSGLRRHSLSPTCRLFLSLPLPPWDPSIARLACALCSAVQRTGTTPSNLVTAITGLRCIRVGSDVVKQDPSPPPSVVGPFPPGHRPLSGRAGLATDTRLHLIAEHAEPH